MAGYAARVHVMDSVLHKFLDAFPGSAQVLSLGAGCDTTFWRLMVRYIGD